MDVDRHPYTLENRFEDLFKGRLIVRARLKQAPSVSGQEDLNVELDAWTRRL